MDILEQVTDSINDFLVDQFGGATLPVDIIYRQRKKPEWSAELRRNVSPEPTDLAAKAILLSHNAKTVKQSSVVGVQVGDRYYMIQWATLNVAGIVPTVNDVIVHDGQELDIKGWDKLYEFTYSFTVKGG